MGQVPAKYFPPSAPYGSSPAANVLNPSQPAAANPQTPLLPPNFQDPGTMQSNLAQSTGIPSMAGSGGGNNNDLFGGRSRMFGRGLFGLIAILFLSASSWATTTVTGTLKNLGTGTVSGGAFVRFWLRGCQGVQPRVNGNAVIAPTQGGVYFQDFVADVNGSISGTVYSTRDATGNSNGEIECPTSVFTATWYGVQLFLGGKAGPETPVAAKNGATLNVTNVTPLSATPVVTAPTGDTVYLRLDGGNSPVTGPVVFNSSLTVSGTTTLTDVTFLSHNSMPWAGPGATATIDQAVTRCTALSVSLQCIPNISPGYTGGESANLFTTSVGYQIYTGSAIISDHRNNVGTPGNGFNSPIYGIIYGGRLGGALNRLGVSNYCHNVTDSCTGQNSWSFLDGTMPPVSNNGLQAGAINLLMMHDTLTLGGTAAEVNGTDSEIHADATSTDNPVLAASSYGGAVAISRTAGVQSVLIANVFRAKQHSNISSSGGKIFYAYGVRGDNQTAGTYRNYAAAWQGNELYENAVKIDAEDTGTLCTISNSPTGATEVNQTVTITTTAPCVAAIAGAHFNISGVGVAGYNGDAILLTGSGGTTFTYYLPGTTNLAASGSGTATPHTPRTTTTFQANNIIDYRPLVDTIGWNWNTQAGTNIFKINSTGILAYQSIVPGSAGLINIGLPSLPISQLVLGNVANQSYAVNPLPAAGNRTINVSDPGTANSSLGIDASNTYVPATNVFTGAWACTNVTPVTLPGTSTTADQNLMACTIPAGTLNRVGRTLRVKVKGIYSTPAASTSQVTLKLKLCTVSGCGSGTVISPINIQSTAIGTVQITNDNFSLRSEITTQTAGASSAYEASGEFLIDLSTLATAADSEFGDTNTATVGTIDSTAQLFLQTTIAFSSASASNVATQRQLIAETVN